jgi:hypothetical protein
VSEVLQLNRVICSVLIVPELEPNRCMNRNINMCVMLCPAGPDLDATHSRNVVMIQFAVGAAVSVFMVMWRWWKLQESKVRSNQLVRGARFAVWLLWVGQRCRCLCRCDCEVIFMINSSLQNWREFLFSCNSQIVPA